MTEENFFDIFNRVHNPKYYYGKKKREEKKTEKKKEDRKPKRREWVEDYFLQLAAYAMAHDVIYGTCVDQGVILMCSKDGFFQKFTSNGADFTRFKHKFLSKIDQFYQKKK